VDHISPALTVLVYVQHPSPAQGSGVIGLASGSGVKEGLIEHCEMLAVLAPGTDYSGDKLHFKRVFPVQTHNKSLLQMVNIQGCKKSPI
jgi:hypothetical protein